MIAGRVRRHARSADLVKKRHFSTIEQSTGEATVRRSNRFFPMCLKTGSMDFRVAMVTLPPGTGTVIALTSRVPFQAGTPRK